MYSLQNKKGNPSDRKVVSLFSALNGFITRKKMNFFWKNNKLLKYAEWGNCQEAERLLQRHPEAIEVRDKYGNTPLLIAVMNENEDMVRLLVSCGANLNARTSRSINDSPYYHLFEEFEDRFIEEYFDDRPIEEYGDWSIELDGKSPLMIASILGCPTIVKELIIQGASINATDYYGISALMCAVASSQIECAEELLKAGADLMAENSKGATAIDYTEPDSELHRLLEEYSGDTEEEDKQKSVKEHLENLKIMFITLSEELIGVIYEACTKEQIQIKICGNCKNAIEHLKKEQYDVIFLDIPGEISSLDNENITIIPVNLPEDSHSKDESGLSDLRNLRSSAKEAFIIRCFDSDQFTMELRDLLIDNGADRCIIRHFSIEQLTCCLVGASGEIKRRKIRNEVEFINVWLRKEEVAESEESEKKHQRKDDSSTNDRHAGEDSAGPPSSNTKWEEFKSNSAFWGMLAIIIAYLILIYLGKI